MNSICSDIKQILDSKIRPALQSHKGDVEFSSFMDGILILSLLGACKHCPNAQSDTLQFIKEELKVIPEIREVILEAPVDESLLDLTYRILNHEI